MTKKETSFAISKKIYIALFLLIFSFLFTVLLYITQRNTHYARIQQEIYGKFVVQVSSSTVKDKMSLAITDFSNLAESIFEIAAESEDAVDVYNSIDTFLNYFTRFNNEYYNIAVVSANGNEIARIDNNGKAVFSHGEQINYLNSSFFSNTLVLKEGEILVSVAESNTIANYEGYGMVDNLVIFTTPLYINDKLEAVLVLNYDLSTLFTSLSGISSEFSTDIDMLNKSGHLISSTTNRKGYGPYSTTDFTAYYPQEWSMLVRTPTGEIGQTITDNGLFTYSKIDLTRIPFNDIPINTRVIFESPTIYLISTTLKEDGFEELFINTSFENIFYTVKNNFFYVGLIFLISSISATLAYYRQVSLKRMQYNSDFDSLTNTYNRRAGMQLLRNILNSDSKSHLPLSICFLDINGLKDVNDVLGHQYGDELIVSIANTINKKIHTYDIFMRVGGDEFILVLKNTSPEEAEILWEKITESFKVINETENRPYNISLSHGIIEYTYDDDSRLDEVLIIADAKMYEDKKIIKRDFKSVK